MNFQAIEDWIRTDLMTNGNLALNRLSKGVKIYQITGLDLDPTDLVPLQKLLTKCLRSVLKRNQVDIYWFKINVIDNAVTQLVGIGQLANPKETNLLFTLICQDTADQGGDTLLGLFDSTRDWVLKITNSPDQQRIYLKIYGTEKMIDRFVALSQ